MSEDFPEPETPVTIVNCLSGISTLMFFKLLSRAPRTLMNWALVGLGGLLSKNRSSVIADHCVYEKISQRCGPTFHAGMH